jgi:hypothetical protein
MIIEIQIRGELLRRIVRNRFLEQAICIADLPGPGQKIVDHLDFGQPTLTRQSADMLVSAMEHFPPSPVTASG